MAFTGLLTALSLTPAAAVPGLFNTGVDESGAPLPTGAPDLHFILTGPLSNAVTVARHMSPTRKYTWVAPPAGSTWIGPENNGAPCPPGVYVYTLQFDLDGIAPWAARLSGEFSSDDGARIFLNGIDTGYSNTGQKYRSLTRFSIGNGFVEGVNTLEFRVTNIKARGSNPTSLLVANLSITGAELQHALITAMRPSPALPTDAESAAAATPAIYAASPVIALPEDRAFGYALPKSLELPWQIEASTDLIHWFAVTNVTFYFKDWDSTNFGQRFYRTSKR